MENSDQETAHWVVPTAGSELYIQNSEWYRLFTIVQQSVGHSWRQQGCLLVAFRDLLTAKNEIRRISEARVLVDTYALREETEPAVLPFTLHRRASTDQLDIETLAKLTQLVGHYDTVPTA